MVFWQMSNCDQTAHSLAVVNHWIGLTQGRYCVIERVFHQMLQQQTCHYIIPFAAPDIWSVAVEEGSNYLLDIWLRCPVALFAVGRNVLVSRSKPLDLNSTRE
jgi:hypothetical protein